MKQMLASLKHKGVRYWITALVILVLATTGSSYVYEEFNLTNARSYVFQRLLEWGPRPAEPKFTSILLIEDDEYWKGPLSGRRPIKRDYLARLIDRLVAADARLIALDFDTRLPDPNSTNVPEDYREETSRLIEAIEAAARKGKKLVLATPISYDAHGHYQRDIDIYALNQLCSKQGAEPWQKNISCGYIALSSDPLDIPTQLTLADGTQFDSFALAIARAMQPELISRLLERTGDDVHYGNFIPRDSFDKFNAELSSRDLLNDNVKAEQLESRAVIVGAHWSRDAAGRGPKIDLHWTPVGLIVGAELHANFVEALLDTRVFRSTPEWLLHTIEIVFSILAAIVFAIVPSIHGKILSIVSVFAVLFFAQWLVLHGFGIFFDVFVPLVGLGLHALYERLWSGSE
jgi:CHASE2 domain-containing sensor protein